MSGPIGAPQGSPEETATWTTYKTIESADGETLFDSVLHKDTHNSIETENGTISPSEVETAPVDP